MDKTDLAYVAGIIDGEGCISFSGRKAIGEGKNYSIYRVNVTVGNTSYWLLEYLQSNFGGSISSHYKIPTGKNHKPAGQWALRNRSACKFLELILPYLHMKKLQAELALKFQARRHNAGGKRLSAEEQALDRTDVILMRSYNKKGQ